MAVRTLRMRLLPNGTQVEKMDCTIDCCRYIYNHMLERNDKVYKRREQHLSYNDMQNLLPAMKGYMPWLKDADSQALKDSCGRLENAFKRFFKKLGGYPKFHSKREAIQSYTTTQSSSIHFQNGKVKIPCVGWMPVMDNRAIPDGAKICNATIIKDHGKYYVSLVYKTDDTKPIHVDSEKALGLDYKSNGLYVDNNGNIADMPHFFRESEPKIANEQHKLSRKVGAKKGEKPSNNFKRQQKRLFKKTRHAANQRKDYLQKLSTAIAKQYDVVIVEDLNMKTMANRGFRNGKATLDNGYGMFIDMLEYKLTDQGKLLIKVSKWFPSSQICSNCGEQNKAVKSLKIRHWICPNCGAEHDRDINAAINIRNEGLRILTQSQMA